MASNKQGITFIGVGNMGLACILALLKADFPVTIWNRTPSSAKVKSAVEAGAILEEDLSKAISANSLTIICLLDYDTILSSFITANTPSCTNKTIINLTNGTPRQSQAMQTWFLNKQNAKSYLDGAIMVTPQMVGGPHSFLVISGGDPDTTFSSVESVLSPIGTPQYLGSDITAAARFDLAALSSMYGMFAGSMTGMALLKRAPGSGTPSVGKVVKEQIMPFLTALMPYLEVLANAWDEERWGDNLGNPMGMQLQGVRNIVEACKDDGLGSGVMEELARMMGKVVERFGSDSGLTALGKVLDGDS